MTGDTLMIQDNIRTPRKSGNKIKCAKCGVTAEQEPSLRFHRFPLPRARGSSRTRAWAEYAFPDKDWSCEQDLVKLFNMHTMLCAKHFDDSAYTNSSNTRLNLFALPSGAVDLREFQKISESQIDHNYAVGIYRAPVGMKPSAARRPHAEPSAATVESQESPSSTSKSAQDSSKQELAGLKNNHSVLTEDAFTTSHSHREYDDTEADVLQEDEVEVKQEQDELARVCRVCLRYCSDAQQMTPLLRGGELTETGKALTAFCPQVKISADDNLPVQLCVACAREAIRAERFYHRVEETHARLATLAPHDVVQYSLSLAHYFPERVVSDKLGEDDDTAVISLRYDGDQHLELSFNKEPSTPLEVEAATENSETKITDEENRKRKRQKTADTTQKTSSDPQNIFCKKSKEITQIIGEPKYNLKYEEVILQDDEEDTLRMEDVSVKDEPLFEASETTGYPEDGCDQLSFEFTTEVDTTFVCPECNTDFLTCLEAEHHMQSAHGPVPAYVCHECSQTVATKRLLREHLRKHSGVKPYECQHCHNKFYSQGDRRRHYVICAMKSA